MHCSDSRSISVTDRFVLRRSNINYSTELCMSLMQDSGPIRRNARYSMGLCLSRGVYMTNFLTIYQRSFEHTNVDLLSH